MIGLSLACLFAIGCSTDQPATPPADSGQASTAPPSPAKGKGPTSNKFKSAGNKSVAD